jgi:hypothetical protein
VKLSGGGNGATQTATVIIRAIAWAMEFSHVKGSSSKSWSRLHRPPPAPIAKIGRAPER